MWKFSWKPWAERVEAPFCVQVEREMLMEHGNMSLLLSEAFIVWEPIQVIENRLVQKSFKHAFLVFALKSGQRLFGGEYHFMRVERQHKPVAADSPLPPDQELKEEALLNIRF